MSLFCCVKTLFILVTTFFFTFAFATEDPNSITTLLSGKIIDKQSGETIAGVKIQIKGTETFCYTDISGCFFLAITAKNSREVNVDMVGYEPLTLTSVQLSLNCEVVLNPR